MSNKKNSNINLNNNNLNILNNNNNNNNNNTTPRISNLNTSTNKSINKSNNVSINKSTNKSNNVSINKSTNKSVSESSEQNILNRLNDVLKSNVNSLIGKSKKSDIEKKEKEGNEDKGPINIIMDNYIIVLSVFVALILLVILFFVSKSFNVGRTIDRMKMFERYQKITNYNFRSTGKGDIPLKDIIVNSSYNSCHSGNQMISYTSENILKQILKSGARYIELNVFASKYGVGGIPVVSSGYKKGEWKLMLNTTTFENAIKIIADNAFKVADKEGGSPNPNDPLFLSLNLSTGHNIYCLDMMTDILLDYLNDYLLDPKYAYQFNNNIQDIKMKNLENKVVIFTSSGFEGSKLEELVNSTWIDETDPEKNVNITTSLETFISNKKIDEIDKIKSSLSLDTQNKLNKLNNDTINYTDLDKINKSKRRRKLNKVIENEFNTELNKINNSTSDNIKDKDTENMEDIEDNTNPFDVLNNSDTNKAPKIIRISSYLFNKPGFDGGRIKEHNKTGLTIVVPHIEGDFVTHNYDSAQAWELGCQFVAMNFQLVDNNIDKYITKFEKKGIIDK